MSLDGNEYVQQPYISWVDFYVYTVDRDIRNITRGRDGRPEHFVDFEHTFAFGSTGTFTLTIFDETWGDLVVFLATAQQLSQAVYFRYYYEGSAGRKLESPYFAGYLDKVTPSYRVDGVEISIEGRTLADALSMAIPRIQTYENLRISDIVRLIAKRPENKWLYGPETIEDTRPLPTPARLTDSGLYIGKTFIQNNVSDLEFIRQQLVPLAVNEKGLGGYRCWLTHEGESIDDQKIFVNFRPSTRQERERKVDYQYFFMRGDRNSEVLEFTPNTDGLFTWMGASSVTVECVDPLGQSFTTVTVSNKDEKIDKVTTVSEEHRAQLQRIGKIVRRSAENCRFAEAYASERQQFTARQVITATARIMGDSRIRVGEVAEFQIVKPNGEPLVEVSGKFEVRKVTNRVSGGGFETELDLARILTLENEAVINKEED